MNIGDSKLSAEFYGETTSCISEELAQYITNIFISDAVVTIANSAFAQCENVSSVIIPDSVTRIEDNAFAECRGLVSITIPNSAMWIGRSAFYKCSSLKQIVLPENIEVLSRYTFRGCVRLESIVMPNNITKDSYDNFDLSAFYDCSNLESITIPNGARIYGSISGCSKLQTVIMDEEQYAYIGRFSGTPWYNSLPTETVDGVEYRANVAMGLVESGGLPPTSISIKDGTKAIANSAFYNNKTISTINLPKSLKAIGNMAFENCTSLINITIPKGVKIIGSRAFLGCSALISMEFPNSVEYIGEGVFACCSSLESIIVPFVGDRINSKYPFGWLFSYNYNYNLEQIYKIKDGTNGSIYCSFPVTLKSVTILSGDIKSGEFDFKLYGSAELSRLSVILCNGVKHIEEKAFYGTNIIGLIDSITIPDSVESIGAYAFNYYPDIYFHGTKDQWAVIDKAENWGITGLIIHCEDGDIKI
ncbi:MAG: leucine-rich repeat protein [Clostridia bacterium]|nr:leucine-rich repeat protein [Clostridia bacterium]